VFGVGADPNLLDTCADSRHRFPVIRLLTALHAPQLKASDSTRRIRQLPDHFPGAPYPEQGLHGRAHIYKKLDTEAS